MYTLIYKDGTECKCNEYDAHGDWVYLYKNIDKICKHKIKHKKKVGWFKTIEVVEEVERKEIKQIAIKCIKTECVKEIVRILEDEED